jgi:hypothetical protein
VFSAGYNLWQGFAIYTARMALSDVADVLGVVLTDGEHQSEMLDRCRRVQMVNSQGYGI